MYSEIKRNYNFEKYLDIVQDKILRNNITRIRTSTHLFPIEYLRKKGIVKEERWCNLCKSEIGTEFHLLSHCKHDKVCTLRNNLILKLYEINIQWKHFEIVDVMKLLFSTYEKKNLFHFSIFLGKLFKLVKCNY